MALLDALLLDPARFDVWISYRTDNQKGSGTASDPWNGSPRLNAPVNFTLSRTGSVATVNLPSGHGLANGDLVVVAGATQEPTVWNGAFTLWGIVGNVGSYPMRSTPGAHWSATFILPVATGSSRLRPPFLADARAMRRARDHPRLVHVLDVRHRERCSGP